ncbi:MAG: hypothetical protein OHK0038_03260 [Flammeovirgaceae bacterium]
MNLKRSSDFKKEIDIWLQEQIISPEQHALFVRRYDLSSQPPWYTRTSFFIQSIAVLFAAVGFILLIAFNWDIFPIYIRMLTGLVPLAIAYISGFYFISKGDTDKAELAFIMASLLFGTNIALQAQIFHISAYFPDGVLWWIIGSIPVMYYFRSTFLNLFLQVLFVVWLWMQNEFCQFNFLGIIILGFILYQNYVKASTMGAIALFFTLHSFITNISIYIFGLPRWNEAFLLIWMPQFILAYLHFFVGLLDRFENLYEESFYKRFKNFGLTIITFLFYLSTYNELINEMQKELLYYKYLWIWIPLFIIGLALQWAKEKKVTVFLYGAISLVWFLPIFIGSSEFFFYLNNALFFGFCVWKIYDGIAQRHKWAFMSGVFYMIVILLTRYFSLFEDFLTSGILFIVCSILLLFINRLWNQRYAK